MTLAAAPAGARDVSFEMTVDNHGSDPADMAGVFVDVFHARSVEIEGATCFVEPNPSEELPGFSGFCDLDGGLAPGEARTLTMRATAMGGTSTVEAFAVAFSAPPDRRPRDNVAFAAATVPGASTTSFTFEQPIETVIDEPCLPEPVAVMGMAHVTDASTLTGEHERFRTSVRLDAVGQGLITGSTYRWRQTTMSQSNRDPASPRTSLTWLTQGRLLQPDADIDLVTRLILHMTTADDGTVVTENVHVEVDCR